MKLLAAVLAVLLVGFGIFYYLDQRAPESPSMNARAIATAEAAVRKAPNNVEARLGLASAYELDGRYQDALTQIDQILKVSPDHRGALLAKGYALLQTNDLKGAEKAYAKVAGLGGKGEFATADTLLQESQYYLGVVREKQGNHKGALEALKAALHINPADADALYTSGLANAALGNDKEATNDFVQALKFVPTEWPEPWQQLAKLYQKAGDAPKTAYAKAMADLASGNTDSAVTQFKALLNGPEKVNALLSLGSSAERQGDKAAAKGYYEQALKADPKNAAAKAGLAGVSATPSAEAK